MTLKEFFEKRADGSAGGGIISGTKNAITGDETGLENAATGYFAGGWSPTYVSPEKGISSWKLSGNQGGFKNFGTGTLGISAWFGGNYLGNAVGQEAAKNYIANPTPEAQANAQRFADQWTEGITDPRQKELQEQDAMTASLANHATDQLAGEMRSAGKSLGKKFWNGLVNSAKWVATRPGPIRGMATRMGMNPEGWLDGFKFQDTSANAPSFEAAGEKIGDDITWLNNTVGRYAVDPDYRRKANDIISAGWDAAKANKANLITYGTPYLAQRIGNTAYNAIGDIDQNIVQPIERIVIPVDRKWKKARGGYMGNFVKSLKKLPPPVNEQDAENRVQMAYHNDPNNPIAKADRFWMWPEAIWSHIKNTLLKGDIPGYFANPKERYTIDPEVSQGTLNGLSADADKAVIKGVTLSPITNLPEEYKEYLTTMVPYAAPTIDEYLNKSRELTDTLVDIGAMPKEKRDLIYDTWKDIKEHPEKAEELYDASLDKFKELRQRYSQDPVVNALLWSLFNSH